VENFILSKYNCFKTLNEVVVGVNLRNKMLFALDVEKYQILNKYETDLEELRKIDPVFFSAMNKLGIIIDSEKDSNIPKNLLLENRIIIFADKSYRLTINPTLNCNFSCWYCYEMHTKKHMSRSVMDATLKYIEYLITDVKINHLNLDWFGGEPLLCYKTVMKPLACAAKELCDKNNVSFQSDITTNGYLITPDMIPFFKMINMQAFQITLDGEKEQHDKTRCSKKGLPSYDKIVSNICLLANELNPKNLALRINYTQNSFDGIFEIIDSFPIDVRNKITVLLQQVWQDKDNCKSNIKDFEEAKLRFEKAGFNVDKNILNIKGYTCYADIYHQALINYDGRIFKCTARNFEKEIEDGNLTNEGTIIWNNSLSKKLSKSTFENNKCLECKYLPVCFGPCSQKNSILKDFKDFNRFCFEMGIEQTLDYIMSEFGKSGKSLAPLLDYR